MNKMFTDHIGKMMEVYSVDMFMKSFQIGDHLKHMEEAFNVLQKYRTKLNMLKCAFGVKFRKVLS